MYDKYSIRGITKEEQRAVAFLRVKILLRVACFVMWSAIVFVLGFLAAIIFSL